MRLINSLLSKVYRKMQIAYDESRSYNIGALGTNSRICSDCDISPPSNVYIGNHSVIGSRCLLWTTNAKIMIGDYVLLGPQVSCISGNHITDKIGKHICEYSEEDKKQSSTKYDADIVIEDGVWIGANATILSGVHIAEGCVIAAGAIVTDDTVPYGIYGGVPAKLIKMRFTQEQIEQHKIMLRKR